MKEIIWPHPKHKYWAILGTLLDLLALVFAAAGVGGAKWFKTKNSQYGVFDSEVTCTKTFCTTEKTSEEKASWVMLSSGSIIGGVGINALAVIVTLFAFWPMIAKKKYKAVLLKVILVLTVISAYLKFFGCFVVVHYMTKINDNRVFHLDKANTEISCLPLGLIFFSFGLEMNVLVAFKVTIDKGIKGLDHIDRISGIQSVDMKQNTTKYSESRRSSSYHPDTSEDHVQILTKASRSTIVASKHSLSVTASAAN